MQRFSPFAHSGQRTSGGVLAHTRDAPHRLQTPVEKAGSTILPRHFGQRSSCIARCTTFLRIDLILVGKPCDPIGLITHTALVRPASLAKAIRVDDPQDTPLAVAGFKVHIPNRLTVHPLEPGQQQRLWLIGRSLLWMCRAVGTWRRIQMLAMISAGRTW